MPRRILCAATIILAGLLPSPAITQDSDGDGLSDFHERYKYLTDPNDRDSDGDGISDGDWLERREYQYVVRSVVQVMRPVTFDYLNDDYQDARVLDQTDRYVELEVIHYPFNKIASTIGSDDRWRSSIKQPGVQKWLEPGPTADWTPEFRKEIKQELKVAGIDADALDDRKLVEKASQWLLNRAEYQDGFSCFCTAFDDQGNPYLPESLQGDVHPDNGRTFEEQWEREVSAVGMFRNKARGSCSSSSIYLNGCLRAIGIPTRTILCIPIVDAGDESEMDMVRRLKQPAVRQTLLGALSPLKKSWASHTFNEVFVDGRWRRLNYSHLGQNIYDPSMFGLMTHVATFHDWADARMHETIGLRQSKRANDVFGGANPYSTISLRDQIGAHCKVELPRADVVSVSVEKIHWTDSPDLPDAITENCKRRKRFGLIADVRGFSNQDQLKNFLASTDMRVWMDVADTSQAKPEDQQNAVRLGIGFDPGCYWVSNNLLRIYVPFGGGDRRDLKQNVVYKFRPQNGNQDYRWIVSDDLTIVRKTPINSD